MSGSSIFRKSVFKAPLRADAKRCETMRRYKCGSTHWKSLAKHQFIANHHAMAMTMKPLASHLLGSALEHPNLHLLHLFPIFPQALGQRYSDLCALLLLAPSWKYVDIDAVHFWIPCDSIGEAKYPYYLNHMHSYVTSFCRFCSKPLHQRCIAHASGLKHIVSMTTKSEETLRGSVPEAMYGELPWGENFDFDFVVSETVP